MIQVLHKFSPPGLTCNGGVERRLYDQSRLFKGVLLTKVAQELKEPDISWQVKLADTTKHPQIGLE